MILLLPIALNISQGISFSNLEKNYAMSTHESILCRQSSIPKYIDLQMCICLSILWKLQDFFKQKLNYAWCLIIEVNHKSVLNLP